MRDAVVGYATLTVYFDPLVVDGAWMEAEARDAAAVMDDVQVAGGSEIDVPVCYGGEFGPDIADVAAFGGCSEEEVIALHRHDALSRLHGGVRARLRLHGRRGSAYCRAAARRASSCCAVWSRRHRRRPDGNLSSGDAWRLEHHRPHAAQTRTTPNGARHFCCSQAIP